MMLQTTKDGNIGPGPACLIRAVVILGLLWGTAYAETTRARLVHESIEKTVQTAGDPLTPGLVMEKVDQACRILEREGEAAFQHFHGKNSPFIFSGTYLWVHTLKDSKMKFHPINPSLEGKHWLYMRDIKGKLYFAQFNEVAVRENGGWVEYYWPRPGQRKPLLKVTYVKKCVHNGIEYVVACGIYGLSAADVNRIMGTDGP